MIRHSEANLPLMYHSSEVHHECLFFDPQLFSLSLLVSRVIGNCSSVGNSRVAPTLRAFPDVFVVQDLGCLVFLLVSKGASAVDNCLFFGIERVAYVLLNRLFTSTTENPVILNSASSEKSCISSKIVSGIGMSSFC